MNDTDIDRARDLAQQKVTKALAGLSPPARFAVLTEAAALLMVENGITPAAPEMFESFLQMNIRGLVDRVRGICHEMGIVVEEAEIEEEPAPTPRWGWRDLFRRRIAA